MQKMAKGSSRTVATNTVIIFGRFGRLIGETL